MSHLLSGCSFFNVPSKLFTVISLKSQIWQRRSQSCWKRLCFSDCALRELWHRNAAQGTATSQCTSFPLNYHAGRNWDEWEAVRNKRAAWMCLCAHRHTEVCVQTPCRRQRSPSLGFWEVCMAASIYLSFNEDFSRWLFPLLADSPGVCIPGAGWLMRLRKDLAVSNLSSSWRCVWITGSCLVFYSRGQVEMLFHPGLLVTWEA